MGTKFVPVQLFKFATCHDGSDNRPRFTDLACNAGYFFMLSGYW